MSRNTNDTLKVNLLGREVTLHRVEDEDTKSVRWVTKRADVEAMPKHSNPVPISDEFAQKFLGQTFSVGGVESEAFALQTERPENAQGKAPEGPYRPRFVQTMKVPVGDREVRVTVEGIRRIDKEKNLLDGYMLTVKGDLVSTNASVGKKPTEALTDAESLSDFWA